MNEIDKYKQYRLNLDLAKVYRRHGVDITAARYGDSAYSVISSIKGYRAGRKYVDNKNVFLRVRDETQSAISNYMDTPKNVSVSVDVISHKDHRSKPYTSILISYTSDGRISDYRITVSIKLSIAFKMMKERIGVYARCGSDQYVISDANRLISNNREFSIVQCDATKLSREKEKVQIYRATCRHTNKSAFGLSPEAAIKEASKKVVNEVMKGIEND